MGGAAYICPAMLQVPFIRQNKEYVLERLAVKHFSEASLVDVIIRLDDERKALTFQYDESKGAINSASKEIGQLFAKGEKDKAEARKLEVAGLSAGLGPIEERLAVVEKDLHAALVRLPNLPSTQVPEGRTPEDNVVVREGGSKPSLPAGALPHWELAKKYRLIDFAMG